MTVIALTGAKGSGKDTVAAIIYDLLGSDKVRTIAFADPIKHQLKHLFKLSSTSDYDLFKRIKISYDMRGYSHKVDGRHVVREIGMLMRSYNEHQFVDYVEEAIKSQPSYHWVITDLRFDNEYLAMRNIGAKIIKVVNNRVQTKDMHITERGFDDKLVDIILPNHGDIGELKSTVNDILERVVKVNETWTNV
jgi:CO dehydrogenase nickel-insertion accessory protein CooC1